MKPSRKLELFICIGFLICAITFFSFSPKEQPEKIFKIKESTIIGTRNAIGSVWQYLDKSNLPQQEAKALKDALAQVDAAIQKDLSDSTLNKK